MKYFFLIIFAGCISSCKKFKDDYLDVKNDTRTTVPTTIADFQAILDDGLYTNGRDGAFNAQMSNMMGLLAGDEVYLKQQTLYDVSFSLHYFHRNVHLWEDAIYLPDHDLTNDDWFTGYKRIFFSNLVLSGLAGIKPAGSEMQAWENAKGSALFYRSYALYELAQQYCKAYDPATAEKDPGLILRQEYDVTVTYPRTNLARAYEMMLNDLQESIPLLPDRPMIVLRPSKAAAYAILARIHQIMGNHAQAGVYAGKALEIWPSLLDFNNVQKAGTYTFKNDLAKSNPEVIFYAYTGTGLYSASRMNIDSNLLLKYEPADLRRNLYYATRPAGNIYFIGSYYGGSTFFTGLAADELYLIRAESYARENDVANAMKDLNYLLQHRYDKDQFNPKAAADKDEALRMILEERRKELFLRGTRWIDLRRLNKEPGFETPLVKFDQLGKRIEVPPASPKYVFPIPSAEIDISGIPQNPR